MEEELDPYLGAREGFMEEAAIIQVSNNYNNSDDYGWFLLIGYTSCIILSTFNNTYVTSITI